MGNGMSLLVTIVGLILIVLVLRDIFHTLFHPSGTGSLSSQGARSLWRVARVAAQHRRQVLPLAGPLALVSIIATWALVLALGWALIYWPHLSEGVLLSTGLDPADNDGFLDAFYLSLVTLATLGYGEITPRTPWLRIMSPLEALVGFALMTASISWILSVYPVLARRRHLAREITLLRRDKAQLAQLWSGAIHDDPAVLHGLLLSVAEQIIAIRGDLEQFPITYYFHPSDRDSALSLALPAILEIARRGQHDPSASVRVQSSLVMNAVQDLTTYVGETFLDRGDGDDDLDDVLAAYAADHLYHEHHL